jgi:hypothetical protein
VGVAGPPAPDARCLNCGTRLIGAYCAACGQKAQDPDPTFGDLVGEAWDAFVSVDGRFVTSVRLLLRRPGVLTRRYLMGHRARFVPPLRLYLVCSVAYFLVSAVDPPTHTSGARTQLRANSDSLNIATRRKDSLVQARRVAHESTSRALLAGHGFPVPPGPLDSASRAIADSLRAQREAARFSAAPAWLRQRYERSFRRVISEQHNFTPEIGAQIPRLMFVLVPVFALLLAFAYRSRRRRYPVHLVTALHLHAFAFVALALLAAWEWLPWNAARRTLGAVTGVWMVAYGPLALREVYGGRLRHAIARTALLAVGYAVIALAAFVAMLFVIMLTY